jgi:hypothetical protein
LLGVTTEQVHTDRLYKALDQLLPHKESLEKHLRQRLGELFELKCDLLLYDVTSTYFEGEMQGCPIAKRGYSRDSRSDRPQVCIGLVVRAITIIEAVLITIIEEVRWPAGRKYRWPLLCTGCDASVSTCPRRWTSLYPGHFSPQGGAEVDRRGIEL